MIRDAIVKEFERQNMTVTELAERSGVDRVDCSRFIGGARPWLRTDKLDALCTTLGLRLKPVRAPAKKKAKPKGGEA